MSKTLNPGLFESGGLSVFRTTGAIPKPTKRFFVPPSWTDVASASSGRTLPNRGDVFNVAPLTSVCSSIAKAEALREELLEIETLAASLPIYESCPTPDADHHWTSHRVMKSLPKIILENPKAPLMITTLDTMKRTDGDAGYGYAIGFYVYDPVTYRWYLHHRKGQSGRAATSIPYMFPEVAGTGRQNETNAFRRMLINGMIPKSDRQPTVFMNHPDSLPFHG